MLPVIPHIISECLKKLNYSKIARMANVDEKFLNKKQNCNSN